jgi:cell division protein FtsB
MIAEIHSRMFRPRSVTMGMRQQVASRTRAGMSRRMARVVALIICLSLVVVFAFSLVMHRQIGASANRLEALKSVRVESKNRNIELLAARAQLASREFIEKRAKEKFQLVVPQQNQIRRM